MSNYGNLNINRNKNRKGKKIIIALICIAVLILAFIFYIGITVGSNNDKSNQIADAIQENTELKLKVNELNDQIAKMQEEIEYRKIVVRKKELEAVKEARAQGDLSENFEYKAAKQDKNRNESRIRYLERMLKTATVVDDSSKSDEIGMDDIVEVEFEEDGEVEKYKLVTSIRGNSMENRVSIESPIGKALKGHRVGDRVLVNVNENVSYYLRVKSIDKTGDEGENIRSF